MKKKTKILLGVLLTLIIAIICYIIVGVIITNSSKEHTVSAISLYSLELLTNENFKRNEEKEKQLKNETITETELIEFLENLKGQNKIESYEQDEYGITVYFSNGGRIYCDYNLPEGYQANSKNSDNSRNNEVNISNSQSFLSVLCAQPCDDISSDVFDNSAETIANADLGYEFTSNMDNSDVTIEFMKSLSNYRVIIWNAHGGYDKNGSSRFLSGENWYDWDSPEKYIEDENEGRIIRYTDGTVGVTSAFFEKYYKDDSFNDTLIYLGSCMGAMDSVLSDTFIKKGAEAVLAYNNTVYTTYNQKMCESICTELVKKDGDTNSTKTVSEALETAKKQNGEKDPTHTAWYDFILHPIFQDYVKKADRAELILTENDDNSFRLVDENKKEDNKQADNVDYEKIYYQYIKDNLNIIDYDKFPVDENNTGVFSALIEDFDNDNVKEMITFTYEKEKGGSVVLNLFKYLEDKVTLCDTSKETIYASGGGNFATNLCGIFEDKTIKIVYDNYSFGGSSNASEYISYQVENDKLTIVNNYVADIFPRYDRFEYKETISDKTFSNSDDFNNAVISSNYDVKSHLHVGYTDSKFNPEIDDYKNNDLFKGNHIFTLVNSDSMITAGKYGFINDNTNLKNQLGISSSSKETTTKVTTTVKNETTTESNLNDELLNYYWTNNIQSPHVYEFKDDNTVIEYDALPNEPKSTWSCCAQGTYSIKNNKLIVDFSYDYGEYSFELQYLTLKENINWDTGLYLQEHLKDNEYFFYEVDFEPATNGPAGNAFYLQKGIKK